MVESVGQAPVSGTQNHHQDRDRLIQVLARKVREVEAKTNGENVALEPGIFRVAALTLTWAAGSLRGA